jgi:hypothetical protein
MENVQANFLLFNLAQMNVNKFTAVRQEKKIEDQRKPEFF